MVVLLNFIIANNKQVITVNTKKAMITSLICGNPFISFEKTKVSDKTPCSPGKTKAFIIKKNTRVAVKNVRIFFVLSEKRKYIAQNQKTKSPND